MKVVAFRHVPFEGLGWIEPVLAARHIECEYADLFRHDAGLPDTESAGGLIFMGGPMSVNDDLPYLRREEGYIREAAARGQPVLGVCLGAQLIARSLGSRVYRNDTKEIGWYDIRLTPAAAHDKVFAGIRDQETAFHWHAETFDLPPGAVLLASSERCRHQAFRVGANIYGLQFHPEVTPEMIADWCQQDANCGDVLELDGPIDPHLHASRLAELSHLIFGRWCELINAR